MYIKFGSMIKFKDMGPLTIQQTLGLQGGADFGSFDEAG
jgi:hypothetical protein